ncbi:MAG: CHAT domain-containing protein [bacterium]|nr:CHAT domain-containing protein [bacterium]
MRHYRFEIFDQTSDHTLLRFYADARLLAERPVPAGDVDRLVDEVEAGYHGAARDLAELGGRLYAWLDGRERWLATAREGPPGLALHVDVGHRLRHLPWELLFADGTFLCGLPNAPCTPVRRVADSAQPAEVRNRPLRVLLMACSPWDVEPELDFEREERLILEAGRRHPIALEVEESGSLEGLRERSEEVGAGYFDVLHLTGHADVVDGEPRFLMENPLGARWLASAEEIVAALGGRWPALIFLSGCKTGQATAQGALPSLCEQVVRAGAPAVLGWALPVGDESASRAAAELYHQLAIGGAVDDAVARTRARLGEEGSPFWHLLRLYADAGPLAPLVTPPRTPGRERLRRRAADREFLDAGPGDEVARSEVCPRTLFVGRRRAIQRCLRVLRSLEGDDDYHEGVLLSGMGGLGKSSLAARLCERLPGYRRMVWVGRIDETRLLHALATRLDDPEAVAVVNESRLSLRQRLRRLLAEHLTTAPVLFVFDDFEHNAEGAPAELRLDGTGRAILQAPAGAVVSDLLAAIRETGSESRVIVTCRYRFALPGPAALYDEALESLRGADLEKKLARLEVLAPEAATDPALRRRATALAAGNPRLLEWLDALLEVTELDHAALLAAMEEVAEDFREQTLLRALLDLQAPECRGLLALLALFELPVDRGAVAAVAGERAVDPHLGRAVALGLAEEVIDPRHGDAWYFVSGILHPLLAAEVDAGERVAAEQRATRHLHRTWWVEVDGTGAERALEIHRLAVAAGEQEIAVAVGKAVAHAWVNGSRFREAEALCLATLGRGADYRILHAVARAEAVLGRAQARQHYEEALARSPQGDAVSEVIDRERGAIMHNLAGLAAQQGEVSRALELWNQSLEIKEKIGDVQGKAATLHNMAGVIAQQGEVSRALELWNQSLEIKEKIGDVQGKAATLANMAWAAGQQDDPTRERQLNLEAAAALTAVRAWLDLMTVLGNLGASDAPDATTFLAQAFWLATRVQAPIDDAVALAAALLAKLGPDAEPAPLVAATALFMATAGGEQHPRQQELRQHAVAMLAECAAARDVPPEEFPAWMESNALTDPARLLPVLRQALEALVPEAGWLFDRALFQG